MRSFTRVLALLAVAAFLRTPAPGQVGRSPQDSVKNRPAWDSLSRPGSTKPVIMTVDSAKAKLDTAATKQAEVKKPRSSTVRTIERQTAPHAAKNVPNVKNTKPTTK